MALVNQISQENTELNYETVTLNEMMHVVEKLITKIINLCRTTPIMETFIVTVWDSLFIDSTTRKLSETFINNMKYAQDPILSQLLAEYYLFEGSCTGWINSENFGKNRKDLMQSLLKSKGMCIKDVQKSLLQNSVLKRSEDGWITQFPELVNLDPTNKYSNIEGVELNFKTGEIDFIAFQGELPVIDINDINEVNQKGLYDTFFSLDQPDPQFTFHPFHQMRYGPDRLQGTRFLSTMLHADYLLKMILTGVEVNPNEDFEFKPATERFFKRLPEFIQQPLREVLEKILSTSIRAHRFWIEGGQIEYAINQIGEKLQMTIGEVKMKVKKHLLTRDKNGKLVDDVDDEDDKPEAQFAYLFTEFYDLIGLYYPELLRLKELYKLACISSYIHRIRSSKQDIMEKIKNELKKGLDEERNICQRTLFYKQSKKKFSTFISTQYPSLQLQEEVIIDWLQFKNEQLLQILANADFEKNYGNIFKSLSNNYFYQKEREIQIISDQAYNWVPAAFCCKKNSLCVYGGIIKQFIHIFFIIPSDIYQLRELYTQFENGLRHYSCGQPHQFYPNDNSTLQDQAERVYVIRQPLTFMRPRTDGLLAHSALLIKSQGQNTYTIVEYQNDSKVHYRKATISEQNQKEFKEGNIIWDKQAIGIALKSTITVGDIKNQMEKNMSQQKYGTVFHNCHVAQESTRLSFGLVGNQILTFPNNANKKRQKYQKP